MISSRDNVYEATADVAHVSVSLGPGLLLGLEDAARVVSVRKSRELCGAGEVDHAEHFLCLMRLTGALDV